MQITAFKGLGSRSADGALFQIANSPPEDVTPVDFTGTYTVPPRCSFIRISGSGTIQWETGQEPESFNGTEYRGVKSGSKFIVG